MTHSSYANSIELPTDEDFKNLRHAKQFAIDIGGSLVKLAYFSTVNRKKTRIVENNGDTIYEATEEDEQCEQLHFIKFETKYIEMCLDFIQEHLIGSEELIHNKCIKVTGGGAFKYKDLLTNKLGLQVDKEDEMECLINGCIFLLRNIPDESFFYQKPSNNPENPEYNFVTVDHDAIFPLLLVNIGSGVSIVKVESESEYERIGGTSAGGGMFWGLGSILTKAKGFDELLDLASKGDHRNIDMLVKDIYGGAYSLLGLPDDLIASSFGKAARSAKDKSVQNFSDADIAKSLLISISNDIGQISYLNAQLHGLKRIYFGGYFIRGHPMTMHTITYAINYWSKGEIQALFLRHEGYLGAVGAFLKGAAEEDSEKYRWTENTTWGENYAGSSGLQHQNYPQQMPTGHNNASKFDMLELDRFAKPLVSLPFLADPLRYFPDAVDLTKDTEAREYWLKCFEDSIDKFAEIAIKSQSSKADGEQRAKRFKEKFLNRLHHLRKTPCAFGSLTVRSLLDTREHCMEEFHFVDPYLQQKQQENEHALKLLSSHIEALDAMTWEDRQLHLIECLVAGNVFDWGAKEVADMLEKGDFGFKEAQNSLKPRPWLVDHFDRWRDRLSGAPHKCAVIFCDNSGADIILGVFPFARELLKRGTKVILCANSRPALNDVTYNELTVLAKRVSQISDKVKLALRKGHLLVMESGQGSPCLDMRYIDFDLSEKMREYSADLLVLEGMGRAIHTNYYAKFTCESLKVAVLKNRWLASRLGGDMFSIVFKFEGPNYSDT